MIKFRTELNLRIEECAKEPNADSDNPIQVKNQKRKLGSLNQDNFLVQDEANQAQKKSKGLNILNHSNLNSKRKPGRPKKAGKALCIDKENEPIYCLCRDVEMICCENDKCKIGWFHIPCVKITVIPKSAWFCNSCKK